MFFRNFLGFFYDLGYNLDWICARRYHFFFQCRFFLFAYFLSMMHGLWLDCENTLRLFLYFRLIVKSEVIIGFLQVAILMGQLDHGCLHIQLFSHGLRHFFIHPVFFPQSLMQSLQELHFSHSFAKAKILSCQRSSQGDRIGLVTLGDGRRRGPCGLKSFRPTESQTLLVCRRRFFALPGERIWLILWCLLGLMASIEEPSLGFQFRGAALVDNYFSRFYWGSYRNWLFWSGRVTSGSDPPMLTARLEQH